MKRMIPTILAVFAVAAIAGLVVLPPAQGQSFFFMENPLIGKPAPDFTMDTTNGRAQNFTQYRDGQNAIIFFWATWCPHCRTQLTELNAQKANLQKKGIKLALVDLGEEADVVRSFLKSQNLNYDVFLDKDSQLSAQYGVIGVPTFFFVDREGRIQGVEHSLPDRLDSIFSGDKPLIR